MLERIRTIAAAGATALAMSVGGFGCAQQTAVMSEPEVEWMLPDATPIDGGDTIQVYAAPGLGASDALGHEIFVRHEERLAQAQMVQLMALADATPSGSTLWLDDLAGGEAMYEMYAVAPIRYASGPSPTQLDAQPITSVDTDSIGRN